MKIYQFSKLLLIAMLSLLVIFPATAQEANEVTEDFDIIEITFEGYISFDADGNILIDGYFLAPAGAISPSLLSAGQYVSVTGIFLNDTTFQLVGIDTTVEVPVECDANGTTEDTSDDCVVDDDQNSVECDANGTTEDTSDDCVVDDEQDSAECDANGTTEDTSDDCVVIVVVEEDEANCTHPVANRIADAFDVSPCEVEAMHDAGNGFGNIAKAYLLAEAANQALLDALADGEEIDPALLIDAQAYIDLHNSGTGWGQIVKETGVSPSSLAPGQLKKRNNGDDDSEDASDTSTETTVTTTSSNGNGNNGNGNGNGNNGNGNGNGNNGNNGNGNGNNGNGNGNNGNGNGNNGNGNGNGKDKDKGKGKNGK